MVTQKLISVRVDMRVLRLLGEETSVSGRPRNFMINRACLDYLQLLDIIRSCEAHHVNIQEDRAFINWLNLVRAKRHHRRYI